MRKLSSDAALVFAADAGARLLGFLAAARLGRVLGTDGFGLIVVSFAFLSYVLWFVDLGLGTLGTREMGRGASARTWAPHEILWTRLALGVIAAVPAFALAFVVYPPGTQRTVVIAALANTIPFALTLEWYFQGIRSYGPLMISRTLTAAIYLVLLAVFVSNAGDVVHVQYLYALANLIPALLLFFLVRAEDSLAPRGLSFARSTALVRQSGKIGFGGVFAQTVLLLPPLVLGYYSTADAGLLGAALRIVAVVLIVDRVFGALFLPAVAGRLATEPEAAASTLERVLRLVIAVGLATVVVICVFAAPIMEIVFGPAFRGGALALAVSSWFAALTLMNSVFTYGLIGAGREGAYLRATLIGGVATAAVTLICVHLLGLLGAAIAMTAGELCVLSLTYLQFRRVLRLRFGGALVVSCAVAGTVIAAAVGLGIGSRAAEMLWGIPVLLAVFTALVLALRGVRRDDIQWALRR